MKGNDSKEKVVASINRYMGLANLSIIAVNPTAAEMQKLLGMEEEPKEPVYKEIKLKDNDGNEREVNKVRLVLRGINPVHVDTPDGKLAVINETITAMHDIFVSEQLVVSSTGKPKILNGVGNDTWQEIEALKANEKMGWFTKYEPLYQAREGEVELLQIFREFLNLGSKDECKFEDYKKIANGDVSELKKYVSKWSTTNAATFLLGVKEVEDKEYQAVYNKVFGRPSVKSTPEKFIKRLNEEYGEFKAVYPSDLKLRVYTRKLEVPDDNPANSTPATTSSWV